MKVTALIPDQLVKDIRQISGEKTLTDALILALKEWTDLEKIKKLNKEIAAHPLEFQKGYSAASVRKLNRNR
jgi:hypothetical protein